MWEDSLEVVYAFYLKGFRQQLEKKLTLQKIDVAGTPLSKSSLTSTRSGDTKLGDLRARERITWKWSTYFI
jgi:hypothetical protein